MAGYLFTFKSPELLFECIRNGVYSTKMSPRWTQATESTLADYVGMAPGDNVYFFSKRTVYGIGEIIEIAPGQTVINNVPSATDGTVIDYKFIDPDPVISTDNSVFDEGKIQRWVIAFKPSPFFFETGIDMDDLLQSNPTAFRSLRVFWNRSFIKLDDEENIAFKAALLRRNLNCLQTDCETGHIECKYVQSLRELANRHNELSSPDIKNLLSLKRMPDGSLKTEMLLEIALLNCLANKDSTEEVFGHWDYINHQVAASPMKAVDYMDRIDIFGYRWLRGYEGHIIKDYLVAELKKDEATTDDLYQLMKYVDWVSREYASNDYFRLKAFLVARYFDLESIKNNLGALERNQLVGSRPAQNEIWSDVTLVTYEVEEDGEIIFSSLPVD